MSRRSVRSAPSLARRSAVCVPGVLAAIAAANICSAGVTLLVVDRTSPKIWRLHDANNDGIITNDPSEVSIWFDGSNIEGTPNFGNFAAFNSRQSDNTVVGGDVTNHRYYRFIDLDHNGDAQGAGESRIILTTSNLSGASLSSPTGVGFFPNGDIMVCNSGSGVNVNPDAIYRLHDANSDGIYDDANEAAPYVVSWPGFGVGNSTYVPFEVSVDPNGQCYMKSSGVNNGIFRFADNVVVNGRADDAGEFVPWFTSANQSGITLGAGFALELDLTRPRSFYINQTVSSAKQILRVTSSEPNADANGPDSAAIVYSTTEAGFLTQDIISLPGGDVLVSDTSGKRIIRLHDIDGDGLFTSAGERTDFFLAGAGPVLDVRQLVLLRDISTCAPDFNNSGSLSVQDIFDFLNAWFAIDPRADFNLANGVTVQDIFDFLAAWFAGCP